MHLAIISDTHDNLANLAEFLRQARDLKVEAIIHCGDVTEPETLEYLARNFEGEIKLVCGNMEIRREDFPRIVERHKNLEIFPEFGEWAISDIEQTVAFAHRPETARPLAVSGRYRFVFYGHTHKPWIEQIGGGAFLANPGTLGGVFTSPTYSLLDAKTGKLELKKLYRNG